jgi:Ribbon-helix-helix protein, copG family
MPTVERTQISLDAAQASRLRRLARERGTSMAALIRAAVDRAYPVDDNRSPNRPVPRSLCRQSFSSRSGTRPLLDAPAAEDLKGADAVGDGGRPATDRQPDRPGPARVEGQVGQRLIAVRWFERRAEAAARLEVGRDRLGRQAACPAIGHEGADDVVESAPASGLTHLDAQSGARPKGANQVHADMAYQVTKPRSVSPAGVKSQLVV